MKTRHWTVERWLCQKARQGHNFSISADAAFIQAASWVGADQEEAQEAARHLAGEAGYRVGKGECLLAFGEYGIEQFNCPVGSGTWLRLEKNSVSPDGAKYSTENVDHASQQAFLMSLWVWWANYIQTRI